MVLDHNFFFWAKIGGQLIKLFNVHKRFFYSGFEPTTSQVKDIVFATRPKDSSPIINLLNTSTENQSLIYLQNKERMLKIKYE